MIHKAPAVCVFIYTQCSTWKEKSAGAVCRKRAKSLWPASNPARLLFLLYWQPGIEIRISLFYFRLACVCACARAAQFVCLGDSCVLHRPINQSACMWSANASSYFLPSQLPFTFTSLGILGCDSLQANAESCISEGSLAWCGRHVAFCQQPRISNNYQRTFVFTNEQFCLAYLARLIAQLPTPLSSEWSHYRGMTFLFHFLATLWHLSFQNSLLFHHLIFLAK